MQFESEKIRFRNEYSYKIIDFQNHYFLCFVIEGEIFNEVMVRYFLNTLDFNQ